MTAIHVADIGHDVDGKVAVLVGESRRADNARRLERVDQVSVIHFREIARVRRIAVEARAKNGRLIATRAIAAVNAHTAVLVALRIDIDGHWLGNPGQSSAVRASGPERVSPRRHIGPGNGRG